MQMPVNIAIPNETPSKGRQNMYNFRHFEHVDYRTDPQTNGFLDITVGLLLRVDKADDISVLIEGQPDFLEDRSRIWQPSFDGLLPDILATERGYGNNNAYYPYRIERKGDGKVLAERFGMGLLEETDVWPIEDMNVQRYPKEGDAVYTVVSFRPTRTGEGLLTFGYRTRQGVLDTDWDDGMVSLYGAFGVFNHIKDAIRRREDRNSFSEWGKHIMEFSVDSIVRDWWDFADADMSHLLIFTAPRDMSVHDSGIIHKLKRDLSTSKEQVDVQIYNNPPEWLARFVPLLRNEEHSFVFGIYKSGAFGRPVLTQPTEYTPS